MMIQVLNMTFWLTGLAASLIGAVCLVKYGHALIEAKRGRLANARDQHKITASNAHH